MPMGDGNDTFGDWRTPVGIIDGGAGDDLITGALVVTKPGLTTEPQYELLGGDGDDTFNLQEKCLYCINLIHLLMWKWIRHT